MKLKTIMAGFPLAALLVAVSYFVLDVNIALVIRKLWMSSAHFSFFSTDIPDFLFFLVCLITVTAWIAFFSLARKGIYSARTRFFQLIAVTVPLANILKSVLKYVFGGITTRSWLEHPVARHLHWFHGSGMYTGFPSGHMAVFTVLAAALWVYYPRYRAACITVLAFLALALVATNYHFVSDIIAGTYLGMAVHGLTDFWLTFQRRSKDGNAGQHRAESRQPAKRTPC